MMIYSTTSAADQPLTLLLKAEKDFPGFSLDFCVGYVRPSGILPLKHMLRAAPKARAVVGLNAGNPVSAFQMLRDDCNVEVYVYPTNSNQLFHPKVYLGTLNTQAWAMVGSSNLTYSGRLQNVEQNLFVTGQRHTEPFSSIEYQIEAFYRQAYLFDTEIEKLLLSVEQNLGTYQREEDYKKRLYASGIRPRTKPTSELPISQEVQQTVLDEIFAFARNQPLEYAYQMLLLLIVLSRADSNGRISVDEAARSFKEFYRLRREAGLLVEQSYGSRQAVMRNPNVTAARIKRMLKESPFPRFERHGLLDISDDGEYFIINPALLLALTPPNRANLRTLAIDRLAEHYKESRQKTESIVMQVFS